jgi:glycerophosphoryl diester phosphodiesterase
VDAQEALGRVLFSSFEHSEILQLWADCPEAKCGFLWETGEAEDLSAEELDSLPPQLMLHLPFRAVAMRPDFWMPYAQRIALWGLKTPIDAAGLGFEPVILIADGI